MLANEIAIKHINEARNLIERALILMSKCSHISDGAVYFIHSKLDDPLTAIAKGNKIYKCKLCLEMYR